MWEEWIYKTILAFGSILILQIVFRPLILKVFKKYNTKGVGFIKGTINDLLISMVPVFRWIFVSLIIIIIFVGGSIDEE